MIIKNNDNIVATYPHVIGSGTTLYDYSGNGNNGTISGAVWTKQKNGLYALDYDGSDDYVDTGLTNTGSIFSVSLWILKESYANDKYPISNMDNKANGEFYIRTTSNCVQWCIQSSGGQTYITGSANSLTDGKWHHLVFTVDSVNITGYINSVYDTSINILGTYDGIDDSHIFLAKYERSNVYFDGKIANVMIFNTALSAERIKQIYREQYIQ